MSANFLEELKLKINVFDSVLLTLKEFMVSLHQLASPAYLNSQLREGLKNNKLGLLVQPKGGWVLVPKPY